MWQDAFFLIKDNDGYISVILLINKVISGRCNRERLHIIINVFI